MGARAVVGGNRCAGLSQTMRPALARQTSIVTLFRKPRPEAFRRGERLSPSVDHERLQPGLCGGDLCGKLRPNGQVNGDAGLLGADRD